MAVYSESKSKQELYIDGVLKNKNTLTGPIDADSGPIFIGRDNIKDRYFEGQMDDLKIYDYALDGKEIVELFENKSQLGQEDPRSPSAIQSKDEGACQGKLLEIDLKAMTIVILNPSGGKEKFSLNKETKILKGYNRLSISDLKIGTSVIVLPSADPLLAESIQLQ